MKDRCIDYWVGIVDLAEGREAPAALHHVERCEDCSHKLAELRTLMDVGRARYFDAPAHLIESVKQLMPQPERRFLRLLRTTTAWSGARAVAEDFQIVAGDESDQVRLMYSRGDKGWEVMGKAPSAHWSLEGPPHEVEIDEDGRFSFTAQSLSQTGFSLIGPGRELVVASAEEMLSSGSDSSN